MNQVSVSTDPEATEVAQVGDPGWNAWKLFRLQLNLKIAPELFVIHGVPLRSTLMVVPRVAPPSGSVHPVPGIQRNAWPFPLESGSHPMTQPDPSESAQFPVGNGLAQAGLGGGRLLYA